MSAQGQGHSKVKLYVYDILLAVGGGPLTERHSSLIIMFLACIYSLEVFLNAFDKGLAKLLPKTLCDYE